MNLIIKICCWASVFCLMSACGTPKSIQRNGVKMKLVWADEFNGSGLPDTSKWGYDLGDGCPDICGWGNNELQYYQANQLKNARVADGYLTIEAHKEKIKSKQYSSARLVTKNKGDWKYGRIEVRAKLPVGKGVWPAIWMLSSKWEYGGWPESGEIDIMEHVGYLPDSLFATVHTLLCNHIKGTQVSNSISKPDLSSKFNVYAIDWDADKIDFYCNDEKILTFANKHDGFGNWPFDKEFHLLLNIAVGGNWGGKMGIDDSVWPQKMLVDYVRVFQIQP